jgi:hypothetical protein
MWKRKARTQWSAEKSVMLGKSNNTTKMSTRNYADAPFHIIAWCKNVKHYKNNTQYNQRMRIRRQKLRRHS